MALAGGTLQPFLTNFRGRSGPLSSLGRYGVVRWLIASRRLRVQTAVEPATTLDLPRPFVDLSQSGNCACVGGDLSCWPVVCLLPRIFSYHPPPAYKIHQARLTWLALCNASQSPLVLQGRFKRLPRFLVVKAKLSVRVSDLLSFSNSTKEWLTLAHVLLMGPI
jgi:hypothetical protein